MSWGPAYENACIHSNTIRVNGDLPTNWYNYVLASAGTIIDKDTTSENLPVNDSKATDSICPKGWTLPTRTQIYSNRNVASFSPVLGGGYSNGTLYSESVHGIWWGSEARDGTRRYDLVYSNNELSTSGNDYRYGGSYIRCVPAP